ncbi:NYN domain-containing protein [Candidatus Shapirobacteria bacterium]|nr:NYN domain-containing protein [Candidatus Shapirobacteria bacterium]
MSFFSGYRSKTSGKEKEVDVKLAVDIVDFAHRDKFSSMYLFSGDADFLQALFAIRSLGKKIFVLSLQNKVLYRAAFFFLIYVIVFEKPVRINFLRFQKRAFIQIREREVTREAK